MCIRDRLYYVFWILKKVEKRRDMARKIEVINISLRWEISDIPTACHDIGAWWCQILLVAIMRWRGEDEIQVVSLHTYHVVSVFNHHSTVSRFFCNISFKIPKTLSTGRPNLSISSYEWQKKTFNNVLTLFQNNHTTKYMLFVSKSHGSPTLSFL